MITITKEEIKRTEKTVDLTATHDEINYRWGATIVETPTATWVNTIYFIDHYQVPMKNSLRKKIRKAIKEHFETVK